MTYKRKSGKLILNILVNTLASFCALFLLLVILESSFRVHAISLQEKSSATQAPEDFWCQYDPVLGWRHIPDKVVPRAYPDIPVVINKEGVRADREYGFERKRILAIGCSFTFGHGVLRKEAWPQQLEDKLRSNGFDYDVINSGVCAYGLDQTYLFFLEKQKIFKPDIVILGLIMDDLNRIVKCRWDTGIGKPRYRLIIDNLVLTNVPVPRRVQPGNTFQDWANILFDPKKSYFVDFIIKRLNIKISVSNNETEKLQITQKILQEFSDKCKENNSKFLVVFLDPISMDPIPDVKGFLIKNKIDFTESSEIFRGQKDIYLKNEGHPNRHGYDLMAEQIYRFLLSHKKEYHL